MIHFIYSHDEKRNAAPWSIGNHVAEALRGAGHEVRQYDWAERTRIAMYTGDILLGHPHPEPGFCFELNLHQPFLKKIAIMPWNGNRDHFRWQVPQLVSCDHFFPISGPKWISVLQSLLIPLGIPFTRLDMAIDRQHYPALDRPFRPPGERRMLYIGCAVPDKGTAYLERLIATCPRTWVWGHIGAGLVRGTLPHGYIDLESELGRGLASQYDFLVMPGEHDANPTTVLEAVSWGLIPFCTSTCGWENDICIDLPRTPAPGKAVMRQWMNIRSDILNAHLVKFRAQLQVYTWEHFTKPIVLMVGHSRLKNESTG